MSTHRETFFTCTYASRGARHTAVIPAWDADMAEAQFRSILEEEPVDAGGIIEVRAPGGRVARRTPFQPAVLRLAAAR